MIQPLLIFVATLLAAAAAAPSPEAVDWLDKLETRGREIKSFSAAAVYSKTNELIADQQMRVGSVHYLAGDAAKHPARFAIEFKDLIVNGAVRQENVDFIFDGVWLVERDQRTRRFTKRQIVRPGEVMDPLQLDGPFPLPLGQKRAEVLARFHVAIIPPAETDPKPLASAPETSGGPLHLLLTPRADAPHTGAKRFQKVDVWFDRKELVPIKVVAVEEGGAETTSVTLSEVKINAETEAQLTKRFDTTPPAEGWHVEIKPFDSP